MLRHLKTHPQNDDNFVNDPLEVFFIVIFMNNFAFNNECM